MALVLHRSSLERRLFDFGIKFESIYLVDLQYALPSIEWMLGEFRDALRPFLDRWVSEYAPGASDCFDFTSATKFYADACHRKTPGRSEHSGLAVGEMWYVQRDGQAHALNSFFARVDSENVGLRFFEPQTQQLVDLNPDEIRSCEYCLF